MTQNTTGQQVSPPIRCDRCDKPIPSHSVEDDYGEFVCQACDQEQSEIAWQNQQDSNLESPPESTQEEQLRTWGEHQKAHKR